MTQMQKPLQHATRCILPGQSALGATVGPKQAYIILHVTGAQVLLPLWSATSHLLWDQLVEPSYCYASKIEGCRPQYKQSK